MARTIKEIQDNIITDLKTRGVILSGSSVSEWRLWTFVIATALHTFEVILDLFKKEIDALTNKITPGTIRWYAEMCYRFQNGQELLFDNEKAMLYYSKDLPKTRIVKIVAISESKNRLLVKAAKLDESGKIIPLTQEEKYNFTAYIDAIKFAGMDANVVSTTEDKMRYNLEVFFNPAVPNTVIRADVLAALDLFKASLGFDSMIYKQRFIDAVMNTEGVITCNCISLELKGATDLEYRNIDLCAELESGYFEYAESTLTVTSIKEINR